jgi:DNA-directed RNA polymerase specialized sigma24 family protein
MIQDKQHASIQEITNELEKLDLEKLICSLENYAMTRLISKNTDDAQDMVQDLFDKLLGHERKWYDGDDFIGTIFGAMKSICSNANKKFGRKTLLINSEVIVSDLKLEAIEFPALDKSEYESIKEKTITMLKQRIPPPDELELSILGCWIEGFTKQQDVAELLDQKIKEILKAKLPEVRTFYKANGYEYR